MSKRPSPGSLELVPCPKVAARATPNPVQGPSTLPRGLPKCRVSKFLTAQRNSTGEALFEILNFLSCNKSIYDIHTLHRECGIEMRLNGDQAKRLYREGCHIVNKMGKLTVSCADSRPVRDSVTRADTQTNCAEPTVEDELISEEDEIRIGGGMSLNSLDEDTFLQHSAFMAHGQFGFWDNVDNVDDV